MAGIENERELDGDFIDKFRFRLMCDQFVHCWA